MQKSGQQTARSQHGYGCRGPDDSGATYRSLERPPGHVCEINTGTRNCPPRRGRCEVAQLWSRLPGAALSFSEEFIPIGRLSIHLSQYCLLRACTCLYHYVTPCITIVIVITFTHPDVNHFDIIANESYYTDSMCMFGIWSPLFLSCINTT